MITTAPKMTWGNVRFYFLVTFKKHVISFFSPHIQCICTLYLLPTFCLNQSWCVNCFINQCPKSLNITRPTVLHLIKMFYGSLVIWVGKQNSGSCYYLWSQIIYLYKLKLNQTFWFHSNTEYFTDNLIELDRHLKSHKSYKFFTNNKQKLKVAYRWKRHVSSLLPLPLPLHFDDWVFGVFFLHFSSQKCNNCLKKCSN